MALAGNGRSRFYGSSQRLWELQGRGERAVKDGFLEALGFWGRT
jgi:hypothetical protein